MEFNKKETEQIAENLRRTVNLCHANPYLQNEHISDTFNLMHGDIKHQLTMARLHRISRSARRKAATLHKGLYVTKEEAQTTIEEIVWKGCRTPMQVAIELRKKGFEGQWMRPRYVRHLVKNAIRRKREKEQLGSKLKDAGKGVPDRFGRPIKSRAEIMCEMLPDLCYQKPTDGIDDCDDEFQAALKDIDEVSW
ncbi:unnamed protein product [Agarophyton chilense]